MENLRSPRAIQRDDVWAAADALLRRLPGAPAAAAGEVIDILRLDRG